MDGKQARGEVKWYQRQPCRLYSAPVQGALFTSTKTWMVPSGVVCCSSHEVVGGFWIHSKVELTGFPDITCVMKIREVRDKVFGLNK